jgi:hypothetical protein
LKISKEINAAGAAAEAVEGRGLAKGTMLERVTGSGRRAREVGPYRDN